MKKCQICKKKKVEYDMKMLSGSWAYLCKDCAKDQSYFRRLGEGIGQHSPKRDTCSPYCNGEKIGE